MRYDHANKENRRRAAAVLEVLRGKLVDASDAVEHAVTTQATTSFPQWMLANVVGVHIYEVRGGWNADLAFKDLPLGVPSVTGNAVPCTSREAALDSAVRQLSLCAERDKAYRDSPRDRFRWFVFEEIEVPVDPDYLSRAAADVARDGDTLEQVLEEMARLRLEISSDESVTGPIFEAADIEDRERLCILCEKAMALGVTQFSLADELRSDYAVAAPGPMH
ncbi:hypothetical protein ACXR8U_09400 [Methylobacterium radiotolerans]|mgnify:CR=1 FL=1|nr:hypothetical protein [Methylobacterium radiotolerans]OXE42417.1 hypothetical protein CCS92_09010 [Methylobacterium radiotolerans]